MESSNEYRRVMSAGTLVGDDVVNSEGEDLGKMKEIMIDVTSGTVSYAVLSLGGFFGMGDKLFAIPWEALAVDEDEERILLDVPRERLENAPGFDENEWPEFADREWGRQIHEHYGYEPYWGEETGDAG